MSSPGLAASSAVALGLPADSGPSARAGARVIWLTATAFCGIWMLGLIPAVTSSAGGLWSITLGLALLGLISIAWAACLLFRRLRPAHFVAVLAASVVVLAADTDPIALAGPYAALVPWVNLAALAAAMLLPVRAALLWIVGISLATLVVVLSSAVLSGEIAAAWRGCVLMAAYPIAVGIAALTTAKTLIQVAAADDVASEERLKTVASEERERAGIAERFQIARLLHDTVVNTFGAVREGASSPDLIQQRSAFDLHALETRDSTALVEDPDTSTGPNGPAAMTTVIEVAQSRAQSLGLTLSIAYQGTRCEMPPTVATEVKAAVSEALVNISKHSGTTSAALDIRSAATNFEVRISDRGKGFADASPIPVPESINLRCRAAGVHAQARRRPGGGAEIAMMWRRPAPGGPESASSNVELLASLIPATRRFTISLLGLFAINTLLVAGVQSVGGAVAALALIAAVIAVAIALAARGIPIPWFMSLTLALSAGVVVYTPTLDVAGCDAIGIGWWGALGGSLCIVVIVLLSGKALWIVAGCGCFLTGIGLIVVELGASASCAVDSMPAILLTDVAFVGAVIAFRRMLTRYGERAEQSKSATEEVITRTAAIREHERVRAVILESVVAEVRPLLAGLADGSIDPTQPQIRQRCSDEEVYLRALVKIDPDLGALGDAITLCVQLAHSRGAILAVQCAEKVYEPSGDQLAAIEAVLRATVEGLPVGAQAWVTLFRLSEGASMTIVAPVPFRSLTAEVSSRTVENFTLSEATDDDQVLVELGWSDA